MVLVAAQDIKVKVKVPLERDGKAFNALDTLSKIDQYACTITITESL